MHCLGRFFANIINLPGHRHKRKSVFEISKMYYLYSQIIKIIEQEMNKIVIHTHVIFRLLKDIMFSLLNAYVFPNLQ